MLSMMFTKTLLLFCCLCIRLFVTNYVSVVLYGVMRNLNATIRVRMLCEILMLLFVSVCCYAELQCYYSCPYVVLRNLDVVIRVSNYVRLNPGLRRA